MIQKVPPVTDKTFVTATEDADMRNGVLWLSGTQISTLFISSTPSTTKPVVIGLA